jgi:hypothetical protein
VTVKVSGPAPAGREAVHGHRQLPLPRLLPGLYGVEAGMTGMGKTAAEVRVYLDVDLR